MLCASFVSLTLSSDQLSLHAPLSQHHLTFCSTRLLDGLIEFLTRLPFLLDACRSSWILINPGNELTNQLSALPHIPRGDVGGVTFFPATGIGHNVSDDQQYCRLNRLRLEKKNTD